MNPIIYEICQYLANYGLDENEEKRFTFGADGANLKIGELVRGQDGVFAVQSGTTEPDQYTPVEYITIDFWARNSSTEQAYNDLRIIAELFHRRLNFATDNYTIYFSHALGSPIDLDRDAENAKVLKQSIRFIYSYLIS